jgi:hypothetical protein
VHFGLAAQLGYAQSESPPVDPNGLPKRVVAVENRAEFEGENRGIPEAVADHASVINMGLMVQFACCVVIFAHNHSEFTTRIAKNRSAVNSLNAL